MKNNLVFCLLTLSLVACKFSKEKPPHATPQQVSTDAATQLHHIANAYVKARQGLQPATSGSFEAEVDSAVTQIASLPIDTIRSLLPGEANSNTSIYPAARLGLLREINESLSSSIIDEATTCGAPHTTQRDSPWTDLNVCDANPKSLSLAFNISPDNLVIFSITSLVSLVAGVIGYEMVFRKPDEVIKRFPKVAQKLEKEWFEKVKLATTAADIRSLNENYKAVLGGALQENLQLTSQDRIAKIQQAVRTFVSPGVDLSIPLGAANDFNSAILKLGGRNEPLTPVEVAALETVIKDNKSIDTRKMDSLLMMQISKTPPAQASTVKTLIQTPDIKMNLEALLVSHPNLNDPVAQQNFEKLRKTWFTPFVKKGGMLIFVSAAAAVMGGIVLALSGNENDFGACSRLDKEKQATCLLFTLGNSLNPIFNQNP